MLDAVTDTHGLIWYLEDSPRLGSSARAVFDACDQGQIVVYIPTICLVEIIYLQEKGRIPAHLKAQLDTELQTGTTGLILAALTPKVADVVAHVQNVRENRACYVITYRGRPVGVLLPLEETPEAQASVGGEPGVTIWEELSELGEEIGRGWQSPLSGAGLLSEMRRSK